MNITVTDRYRIESSLGHGASGTVYKAWDNELNRFVAIKVAHKGKGYFIAEDRLAGNLVQANIVTIYRVESVLDVSYVSMEYVNGPDLRAFCEKEPSLKPVKVVEIMIDTLKGLSYGHGKGFIHKNIKPSNIILDENGTAKITDYGIAQTSGRNRKMGFWGSPDYMAPEQLKGRSITLQSDIFSLGCVFYELLKGEKPFRAENQYAVIDRIMSNDPEPFGDAMPCRDALMAITSKALSKDPNARYQSCIDFAADLSRALGLLNKEEQMKKSSVFKSITDCVNMFKSSAA